MKPGSDTKERQKLEVKLGSRSLIIEQCQLDNLLEALTEMNDLAVGDKALMDVGSA
jgi:hypothetical protein